MGGSLKMALNKINDWDSIEAPRGKGILRKGGHPCIIKRVEVASYGWGDVLIVYFDIAGGDQKGFYQADYESQTQNKKWKGTYRINVPSNDSTDITKKVFKGFICALEASNQGYRWNWDEMTLTGKLFGGVFGNIEYEIDGRTGFYVGLRWAQDITDIEHAQVPADKLLKRTYDTATASTDTDDDLPF